MSPLQAYGISFTASPASHSVTPPSETSLSTPHLPLTSRAPPA